jgi:hypothetical protein
MRIRSTEAKCPDARSDASAPSAPLAAADYLIFAVVAKIMLGSFETSFSRLAKPRKDRCFDAASCGVRSCVEESTDCYPAFARFIALS